LLNGTSAQYRLFSAKIPYSNGWSRSLICASTMRTCVSRCVQPQTPVTDMPNELCHRFRLRTVTKCRHAPRSPPCTTYPSRYLASMPQSTLTATTDPFLTSSLGSFQPTLPSLTHDIAHRQRTHWKTSATRPRSHHRHYPHLRSGARRQHQPIHRRRLQLRPRQRCCRLTPLVRRQRHLFQLTSRMSPIGS